MKMAEEANQDYIDSMIVDRRKDILQFQLDYSDKVAEIENRLRGYRKTSEIKETPDGEVYSVPKWEKKSDPLLNEDGINFLVQILDGVINKNAFLSNINRHFIEHYVRNLHNDLIEHLCLNWRRYEVNIKDISQIVWLITPQVYFALKRAQGGGERKDLSTVRRIVEQITPSEGEKRKTPNIFGRGRQE